MLLEKVDDMPHEERGFHRAENNRNGSNTRVKVKTSQIFISCYFASLAQQQETEGLFFFLVQPHFGFCISGTQVLSKLFCLFSSDKKLALFACLFFNHSLHSLLFCISFMYTAQHLYNHILSIVPLMFPVPTWHRT